LINGKAKLVSEHYCDGLGDCLPECPTGAITIAEDEVAAYDHEAVKNHLSAIKEKTETAAPLPCGCPGTQAKTLMKKQVAAIPALTGADMPSQLGQWPCQLKLVAVGAPYFDNAHLLIAADCTAFAYANIHQNFMRGKITLIGCPKLDDIDYSEKLTAILKQHEINSVTILKIEVPCCSGIVHAVKEAFKNSDKMIPWKVITVTTDGSIVEE
jgi:hypothetical protein